MEPENEPLEEEIPIRNPSFSGSMLVFGGGKSSVDGVAAASGERCNWHFLSFSSEAWYPQSLDTPMENKQDWLENQP